MSTRLTRTWTIRVTLTMLAAALVSAQQAQQPVFPLTTEVIGTDLRVKDAAGKFIPDLTINDFEILEDGVPQKITNMVLTLGGRQSPPVTDAGRVFIILVDDIHIQFKETIATRKILQAIRDTVLLDGDLIGIVSTGSASPQLDLTLNKQQLNQAINRVSGSALSPKEIIDASQTTNGPAGIRRNTYVAFKTAYDMLEQASKIQNRRKTFVYLSEGYHFNPYTQARFKNMRELRVTGVLRSDQSISGQTGGDNQISAADLTRFRNPFESNRQQFTESDLNAALAELTETARRANVTFYPLDPRGLRTGPSTTTDSLKVLADETGGFCICASNDYAKALQRIDNEMSDYYLLGYVSSNPDPLKAVRNIEIRAKRPGLKLDYNPTYTIKRK